MPDLHLRRTLLTGMVAVIPLCVTWIVFAWIFVLLARLGAPIVGGLAAALAPWAPGVARAIGHGWATSLLALLLTLVSFYLLGWLAHRVVGKRLLAALDALIRRVPLVRTIYDAVQNLVATLHGGGGHGQRVVLVDFPHPGFKAVALVTRTWTDANGRQMAAVFVPTTPNPTSGYLELLPAEALIATDWTVDQAMAMVLSGGAVGPQSFPDVEDTVPNAEPPAKGTASVD
ncbi:MAG TPA: DUF502 domain-containing protein [Rhodanobacteraceae bacterium]|nr:DUF502 domain-containing protein [Rhodanobacteraceae bacterium]